MGTLGMMKMPGRIVVSVRLMAGFAMMMMVMMAQTHVGNVRNKASAS